MFERFTDQARRVVVLAQEEARTLGHGYIGTEHLLLGLLSEGDGLAARALGSLGITLGAAREQVGVIIGEGTGQPGGHIPFTPRAKKVLELSLREAQRLGDGYIGTEHILLGLAREGDGVGAQVLDRLGAPADRVLAQVTAAAQAAPGGELRRVSVGRPMAARGLAPGPVSLRAVLARLDEISERLTAIESHLAGLRGPRAAAAPAAAPEAPASGQDEPAAGGQDEPAAGGQGASPASGQGEPADGGQGEATRGGQDTAPAGGEEASGEPPAAQV